jgi:hypothetical protein
LVWETLPQAVQRQVVQDLEGQDNLEPQVQAEAEDTQKVLQEQNMV